MSTKYYAVNVLKDGNADSTNDYTGYASETDIEQELFQAGYEKEDSGDWVANPKLVPEFQPERVRIVTRDE